MNFWGAPDFYLTSQGACSDASNTAVSHHFWLVYKLNGIYLLALTYQREEECLVKEQLSNIFFFKISHVCCFDLVRKCLVCLNITKTKAKKKAG